MPTLFYDKIVIGDSPTNGLVTFNDPLELPLPVGIINWGCDVYDGWDSTVELDAQFTPIGGVDGEIPHDFFPAKGKTLILGGYVHATTREIAYELWDILTATAFPRNQELVITRHEPIPKFYRVRVVGPRDRAWVGPTSFRWGVPVRASDPFKYGLDVSSGTAGVAGQSTGGRRYPRSYPLNYPTTVTEGESSQVVIIVNTGTAASARIFVTITGPLTRGGWRLVNETTNSIIKFDVGMLSTDVLTIDFFNEVALLNGSPVTASITGDFWRFEPGANQIKLFGDFDPAAGFSIAAYSAWE